MTYNELLVALKTLSNEQLNQTVTVYDSVIDEYKPANFGITLESDVLDNNHAVLVTGE